MRGAKYAPRLPMALTKPMTEPTVLAGKVSVGIAQNGAIGPYAPTPLRIMKIFIILSGVGAYGPMAPFWAIPTETLPAKTVGSVMGFVNAIGNLGAYFAPLIVGYLNKTTGNFLSGFAYLGAITVVGGALCFLLRENSASQP